MLSTSQRAPGYRFQYQVPPTPPPASNTRAERPSPRRRCSMYIPAKPAPTTTASKTAPTSAARFDRVVVSAVIACVVSWLAAALRSFRSVAGKKQNSIIFAQSQRLKGNTNENCQDRGFALRRRLARLFVSQDHHRRRHRWLVRIQRKLRQRGSYGCDP